MPKVEIKRNEIWVGKKKTPMISGEVHYWRLNPSYWAKILEKVREMGLDVVATYVPWDYHEYQRGKFDFTGKTDQTRNLKRFLELTKKMGFQVIIRPGPYIYSEWPNEGAPAYAFKYHRLHPIFLKYATNYLERVCKIIKPFLATERGGHIIMLQADNEIDPWPDIHGPQYGLAGKPGLFQKFLKELYHNNLEELNNSWGTDYRKFDEAGPFIATMLQGEKGHPLKGDKELRRNIDYFKFKYHFTQEVAKWNMQTFRSLGIDVPIFLNVYPFFYAHDWEQLQSVSDLVGIDLYPTAEFAQDDLEQRKMIDKIRFLKQASSAAYIAEFSAGVWHGHHYQTGVLTPNHYRLITLSAILGGVVGWNWYMLVNRDNWYMSPINEWGRVRGELYDVFKNLVSLYRKIYPPTLKKINEIGVTFNPIQYAARTVSGSTPVLVALCGSDIDYELYNPMTMKCDKKFLFYSGNQWLDQKSHHNLRSYVEAGGTLIAFRDYPRKNAEFENVATIGFEEPKSTLFEFKKQFELQIGSKGKKISLVSSIYTFQKTSAESIEVDFGSYGKHKLGYVKKIGKGKIVHLGVEPTPELVMELLRYLKANLSCYSLTKDITTALFHRGKKYYVVVTNNGEESKSATIFLPALQSLKGKMSIKNVMNGKKETHSYESGRPFTIDLDRKDGTVFELSPA
jgi:beta-galactosidase